MERLEINGQTVYEPTAFQKRLHGCGGKYPLAGGAAGPGKSMGLRWQGHLWCLQIPYCRVLLLRRQLRELNRTHIRELQPEIPKIGARWYPNSSEGGEVHYPNGALMEVGHCQHDRDVQNYLSSEYDLILFDELVTFSEYAYLMIRSRARTTKPNLREQVAGGTNPGMSPVNPMHEGLGANWVKRRWIDRDVTVDEDPEYVEEDYPYLPATLADNPHLHREEYARTLRSLPPALREAYLNGSWDLFLGQFFPEFRPSHHVQDRDEDVRPSAPRICGLDWGWRAEGVVLWAVMLPTGQLYVEDELTFNGPRNDKLIARDVAEIIKARHLDRGIRTATTMADPALFKAVGNHTGETMAETFSRNGVPLTPAKNDRIHGWAALRQWLRDRPSADPAAPAEPWLLISPRCGQLRRTLPQLTMAEAKDGDCATNGPDHWADTLRYIVAGRPQPDGLVVEPVPGPDTMGWMKQQILNAAGRRRGSRLSGLGRRRIRHAA